jgi:hypothetical protein
MTIVAVLIAIATLILHGMIWAHTRVDRQYNVRLVQIWRRYKRLCAENERRYEEKRRAADQRFQETVDRFRAETRSLAGMSAPKAPPVKPS